MTVKHTTAALLSLSLAASTAAAQAKKPAASAAARSSAPACNIQSAGSTQISSAYDLLNTFASGEPTAEGSKHLVKAVGLVTGKADKPNTETARAWVLGQALAAYTMVPGQATMGSRATFGFSDDPQGTVDIIVVADSALASVAATNAGCVAQIEPVQRMLLVAAVNEASAKFNAGDMPATKELAARVLKVRPNSPHAEHLLANVAVREQDYKGAVERFEKVMAATKGDSTLGELYSSSLQSAAYILGNLAEATTGDESAALAKRSAGYFQEYLATNPDDAQAKTAMSKALAASGDSTAANAMFAEMMANPGKYRGVELINAGVQASNAGRGADAVKLVQAGLVENPYLRDGLFVLAQIALQTEDFQTALDASHRLIALDPANPDNYTTLANAYQGLVSSVADKKQQRAYLDSLQKATTTASKLPARVTVTDFSQAAGNQVVMNGSVENLGDKPADFTLTIEFLDKAGNVVATKQETVAGVAPKSTKSFSVSVEQPGVIGYRYAPLGG